MLIHTLRLENREQNVDSQRILNLEKNVNRERPFIFDKPHGTS